MTASQPCACPLLELTSSRSPGSSFPGFQGSLPPRTSLRTQQRAQGDPCAAAGAHALRGPPLGLRPTVSATCAFPSKAGLRASLKLLCPTLPGTTPRRLQGSPHPPLLSGAVELRWVPVSVSVTCQTLFKLFFPRFLAVHSTRASLSTTAPP